MTVPWQLQVIVPERVLTRAMLNVMTFEEVLCFFGLAPN